MGWMILYGFLLLLLGLLITAYVYGKHKHSYFKNTGVKYIQPPIPLFGNNIMVLLGREHMFENFKKSYDLFPDQKYFGIFDGSRPLLVVRDPELIKTIGIKEFDTFHDHRMFTEEDNSDIFTKSLFALQGLKWKDMRATLSPAFSSSKMRNMFIFVEECARNMSKFFLEEMEKEGKDIVEIESKDTFSKYTVDTIATTAFGIEINSLKNETNEFYRLSKVLSSISFTQVIKVLVMSTFPKLAKILELKFSNEKVTRFFYELITSSMKNREENKIVRPDMVHLLMEAKKGRLEHDKIIEDSNDTGFATVEESNIGKQTVRRKWDDEDFAAQAFLFFAGGFDTTSNFLSFFFYEMVRAPEIQKKLQEEIDQIMKETDDKFIYNSLPKLKYLDMCVSETLRMWPIAPFVDRKASKDYTFSSPSKDSDITFQLKAGLNVFFPVYAIHHDPQYYPDPEKFDPERFSDENKSNINAGAYLPFGIGPRNCIGSRYALMVVKAIIFHILLNFDVVPTEKTVIPVQLANVPFNLRAKNGFWIGLKKRHS